MRSSQSDPPSSPGTTNNKNVYSQPPPSTANVNVPQPSMPVGVQSTHASVQHSVSLNMNMPPNGVVVTYNNPPPPFVPPSTTQSQQGMLLVCTRSHLFANVRVKWKVLLLFVHLFCSTIRVPFFLFFFHKSTSRSYQQHSFSDSSLMLRYISCSNNFQLSIVVVLCVQ